VLPTEPARFLRLADLDPLKNPALFLPPTESRSLENVDRPSDILRLCLRSLPIFQDWRDHQLWDIRTTPPVAYLCEDCPELLEMLMADLFFYDKERRESVQGVIDDLPVMKQQALDFFGLTKDIYVHPPSRKRLASKPFTPTRAVKLEKDLRRFATVLTRKDYQRAAGRTEYEKCDTLVKRMREYFDRYGPRVSRSSSAAHGRTVIGRTGGRPHRTVRHPTTPDWSAQ
jgi:hypothetical protein